MDDMLRFTLERQTGSNVSVLLVTWELFFDDTGRDGEFSFTVNESPWLGFVSPLGFKEKPFIVPCEVGKGH